MKRVLRSITSIVSRLFNAVLIKHYSVKVDNNVNISGILNIAGVHNSVSIGAGTMIHSGKYDIPIGFPVRCSFWTIGNGRIIIGERCGISNSTFCSSSEIRLGNRVLLGGGVKIYDTDFHSLDYRKRIDTENDDDRKTIPVIIEDDVFVGAGTIILKGTKIGRRAVIGAGSVVHGTVPEDEIWAGNPAHFIKKIER